MSQHHDPVHPDSGHPTPELLADLAEGLLDATSAQHAQAHLDQCSLCQGVQASLRDVSSTLAALPTPSMPDDVEAQILAALPEAAGDHPLGAPTVVPLAAERTRRRGWAGPSLGIAASAALVLFVGGLIYPALTGSDDDNNALSGATGDRESSGGAEDQAALDDVSLAASSSGTNYQTDKLTAQVDVLVADREHALRLEEDQTSASASPSVDPTSSESAPVVGKFDAALARRVPMATDPAAVQACLEFLLVPDATPLAVDIGRYEGELAAIIVLPDPKDPDKAEVYIVGPDCSGPESDLLLYASIPRP